MSSTLGDRRDAQAPSHPRCLLPSVAHTASVTEVTPAKKITFLKRGDPQFTGVRLAVHQRTFKTFSALMDELSQRVPLSFGVRSVTTPRGLHGLSALEQLQDGGCYLCSDKKLPKTPREPSRPQRRGPSAMQLQEFEGGHEAPGTSSSWKSPMAPRRMTLVKNGVPGCQQTVVLSHRNTRNLMAFFSKASELLHFPVKQVFTITGKKVDSVQTLLHGPSMLVCAGNEAFRRTAMENHVGNRMGTLSGLTAGSKSGYWGPKAKQSVMHSRSRPGGRLRQFSLLSERSGLSDHPESSHPAWVGPVLDRHPQDTPALPGPLVTGDDVEKKVCMNEDGSLSVEMKVRFQILGEDALRWSQRMGHASIFTGVGREGQVLGEADPLSCRQEGHTWGFSELGEQGLGPCDGSYQGTFDGGQHPGPGYDIWRNPLTTPKGTGPARRRWGVTQLSHCRDYWNQGDDGRKRHVKDSASPASSPRHPESSQPGSCCRWTLQGGVVSDSSCLASSASSQRGAERETGESPCSEGTGLCGLGQRRCLGSGTQGVEVAFSNTSVSAQSYEESGEWTGHPKSGTSQARAAASQGEATRGDSTCVPTLSPLSLSHMDLHTEKYEQGTRYHEARGGSVPRLPLTPDRSGPWDSERHIPPATACAPAQQRRRKQRRPASAVCLPSVPVCHRVTQKAQARQCCHDRDTQASLDSLTAPQMPRPLDRGNSCTGDSEPQYPQNSSGAGNLASKGLRSPFFGSFDFQDPPAVYRSTTTHSSLDCVSSFYHPGTRSEQPAEGAECAAHCPAPTPVRIQGAACFCSKAGSTPEPSSSVLLNRWPEAEDSGPQDCCCSQIVASSILGTPNGQTQALISEACWVDSSVCPTHPKEHPYSGKHPSNSRNTSSDHRKAEGHAGPRRVFLRKPPGVRGGLEEKREGEGKEKEEEQEEEEGVTPSALPCTSPDAVVREWLSNILEEPVLVTYEIGENTEVAINGPECSKEDPGNDCSLKGLEELAKASQQPPEVVTDEYPELTRVLPETGEVCFKSGGGPRHDIAPGKGSRVPAEVGERTTSDHGMSLGALPSSVSASTQFMKALLGSKQGQPSSLPEVSSALAQRLSSSAGAVIACLARLHIFDEDLGPLAGKVGLEESPKYRELLSISQALWPGSEIGRGQLDVGLGRLTSRQALQGTEDFTLTSSSGVDVSSGSGGSGEGSVPCAKDSTRVPKRVELPLEISSQRPESGIQGHPDVPSHSTVSPSSLVWGCTTGREDSQRGDGEPMQASPLEQLGESSVLEEETQLEGTEEAERERPQAEGVQREGLLGGAGVSRQGVLADCQDAEGSPEEDAGRDAVSAGLWPPDQREEPAEPSHHLERASNVSRSQSVPKVDLGLEELPRMAVMGSEQAHARSVQGARKTNGPIAHRASLDPDPIWVSKLLKKIEKAFMAHLAGATAELRARWSLHDNDLLDQMVMELEQDVDQRLQACTDRELRKIQSRAGRMTPKPPQEALRGQTSLQPEQRRRRLQGLRNFSAFPGQGPLPLTLENGSTLSTALGTRPGWTTEDEFCPCEACLKKKMTPMFPKDTTAAVSAPVRKDFDLLQILQSKKGRCRDGEAAGVGPGKTGLMPPQGDPRSEQGADEGQKLRQALGPGVDEGEKGEGNQRPSREEDPGLWELEGTGPEDDTGTEKDRKIHTNVEPEACQREENVTKKERTLHQGSGDGGTLEAAGQGDGNHSVEIQEVPGEGQTEAEGGNQGEKENGSWIGSEESQKGEASENVSLDQEERPHVHHRRPGPHSHHATHSSRSLSLGNCSQVSQKGSEEDCPSTDLKGTKAEDSEMLHVERKVTTMYPESSTSEQEDDSSGLRTPGQGKGEGCDVEDKGAAAEGLACVQVGHKVVCFGQDDLDF